MPTATLVADLPAATVRQVSVSDFDNNVYLVTAKATGAQVLVDAADDPAAIDALIQAGAADAAVPARVEAIVTTHSHGDHVRALAAVAQATGAPVIAGEPDAAAIAQATGVTIARTVATGDTITVPGLTLGVIGLRGHTPGSIALVLAQPGAPVYLLTGDSLFPGGVGNTNNDPARFAQLFGDVTTLIFDVFADDTVVLPGHGLATTLGAERPHLAEWRARGW
jgi:glyoxylase-like metal-dependent hydrolase (beta-lactamase superfamily II)